MKKNKVRMLTLLNVNEMRNLMGGFAPLTKEQQDKLRERYGLLADIICS